MKLRQKNPERGKLAHKWPERGITLTGCDKLKHVVGRTAMVRKKNIGKSNLTGRIGETG